MQHIFRSRVFFSLVLVGALIAAMACRSEPAAPAAPAAPEPAAPAPAAPAPAAPEPAAPAAPAPAAPAPAAPEAPTAIPVTPAQQAPAPQSPAGTLEIVTDLLTVSGLPRAESGQVGTSHIGLHVAETLFIPEGGTGSNIVTGWLAESWDLAPGFDSATIKLREGVQFHHGFGEMTAEDVAWNFNDVLSPESLHSVTGRYRAIFDPMEVVDTYTVELPFKTPQPLWNSSFLNQFSGAFPVVSKSAYDQHGPDWMIDNIVGTGAYEAIDFRASEFIFMEAVPDHYYNTARMQRINVREVTETSTRQAMLDTGQAQAGVIPLRDIRRMLEQGFGISDAGKSSMMGLWYTGNYWEELDYLCLQGRTSPNCPDITPGESLEVMLDRPGYDTSLPWIGEYGNEASMEQARQVRWAMSMAVDREIINEILLDDLGGELHSGSFPVNDPNWDPKWEIPYDPAQAESILDSVGFPRGSGGVRFTARLYIGPHIGGAAGTGGEMGDVIGGMWDSIGIMTEILKTDYAVYRPAAVNREINQPWLNACGGGDARESTPWDWPRGLVMTSMSRGGFGCGIEIPEVASLYDLTVSEPDFATRVSLNNELQEYYNYWMLNPGVVVVPDPVVWNTRAISSWDMRASSGAVITSLDNIVPAP